MYPLDVVFDAAPGEFGLGLLKELEAPGAEVGVGGA